jgi:hypothetical protein
MDYLATTMPAPEKYPISIVFTGFKRKLAQRQQARRNADAHQTGTAPAPNEGAWSIKFTPWIKLYRTNLIDSYSYPAFPLRFLNQQRR